MKKLVLIAAIALGGLTGCGGSDEAPATSTGQAPAKPDSGVVQCQKLATTTADDSGVPTDEQIEAARSAWEGSAHSDLERAGLKHLALVEEYYEGGSKAGLGEIIAAKAMLIETCAKHGVVVPTPTMPSLPAIPSVPNPFE